ncbi:MAG: glutathione peroxidase [Oscillospiraceae bacterium]|nr:glutathione peroxidase [Oscillospiraceae bacterium]
MGFYDFTVTDRKGNAVPLSNYKDKVVLVVNTATGCGFTPQYEGIEKMYEVYHDQGFEVLDIPCNQFGGQAPGTDDEIHEFCTAKYKTQFPQMRKSDVNGENELPLYTWLKGEKGFEGFTGGELVPVAFMEDHLSKLDPDYKNNPNIKWNFTKFIIDRAGNVVKRFEPTANMADVEACVAALL